MLARITKLRDDNRIAKQSLTSICTSVFAGMTSKKHGDSPANGFGLDRIMTEDAKRRERVPQRHSKGWDPDLKMVGKAVNVDIAGLGDEVDTKSKLVATHRAGANKKAAITTSISESKKCLAVPHTSRQEPLHIIHNEEKVPRHSERGSEVLSHKRKLDSYTYQELLEKPLEGSGRSPPPPSKRRKVVEVISLDSSNDELSKPAPLPYFPLTDTDSFENPLDQMLQSSDVEVAGAHNSRESDALKLTPSTMTLPSRNPVTQAEEPALCPEQLALVNLILSGRNVFYTGSAGCGKSTVLKAFVKRLKEHPTTRKKVDIIAPTGRAALDINGSTFWTYAGWTPDHMKKPLQDLKRAAHGKFVQKRLRETDVLVIDEISMVENQHFERLNQVMKEARGSKDPFGGVQIVVTGDFCQLPPVKPFQFCLDCGTEMKQDTSSTIYTCARHKTSFQDNEKWAFMSRAWEECQFAHVNLTNIHRQSDVVFIAILQKCRLGIPLSPKDEDLLLHHNSQTGNAVRLFATREEVRVINKTAFDRLPTQKRDFGCYDDFRCHSVNLQSKDRRNDYDDTLLALRDHRFEPCISLKRGMQIVLLVNLNIEAGLVNGSQGVITGFEKSDPAKLPKAKEKGKADQTYSSVPALTGEHADVRSANIKTYMDRAATKELPIVLFQNRVTQTIFPDCRVNELGDVEPYSLLSRTQIPLVAGWAMTVHKSQGMTLNRVVVNLSKSFEEGQLYVALSRARSLQGLKVEGLGRQQSRNEQVRQFLWDKFGIR